jgi:2,3-bisphosphoglycerate-independent phosphoglycerate mutase
VLRTHSSDFSPFAVLSSVEGENAATGSFYHEAAARDTGVVVSPGHLLMDHFMKDWRGFVEKKG